MRFEGTIKENIWTDINVQHNQSTPQLLNPGKILNECAQPIMKNVTELTRKAELEFNCSFNERIMILKIQNGKKMSSYWFVPGWARTNSDRLPSAEPRLSKPEPRVKNWKLWNIGLYILGGSSHVPKKVLYFLVENTQLWLRNQRSNHPLRWKMLRSDQPSQTNTRKKNT
jgi:hypothetical protein